MAKQPEAYIDFEVYEGKTNYMGIARATLPNINYLTQQITGAGIAGNVEAVLTGMVDAMSLTLEFRSAFGNVHGKDLVAEFFKIIVCLPSDQRVETIFLYVGSKVVIGIHHIDKPSKGFAQRFKGRSPHIVISRINQAKDFSGFIGRSVNAAIGMLFHERNLSNAGFNGGAFFGIQCFYACVGIFQHAYLRIRGGGFIIVQMIQRHMIGKYDVHIRSVFRGIAYHISMRFCRVCSAPFFAGNFGGFVK